MRLRPYRRSTDFEIVSKWIEGEKKHALWCANLISYPLTKDNFHDVLEQREREQGGNAYVFTDNHGCPVGFFVMLIKEEENAGYLQFVIVDNILRGQGFGTLMLRTLKQYAKEILRLFSLHLCVFDVNKEAVRCYESAGFVEEKTVPESFSYQDEKWGRCFMKCSLKEELS